jgi:hypothetical protein
MGLADEIFEGLSTVGGLGKRVLASYFDYPDREIPLWMFRTGLCAAWPERNPTLRREIADVLAYEDTK